MSLLLGIDTETVRGFKEPQMVQVAAVLYNDVADRIEAQLDAIIQPDDMPIEDEDEAVKIHGIDQGRAEAFGLPGAMVCNAILHMVKMADAMLCYNDGFDPRVLVGAMERYGLPTERLANMQKKCVMKLAAEHFNLGPSEAMAATGRLWNRNVKLGEAYERLFGTPLVGAHGAFTDCRAMLQIYRHITRSAS